MHWQDRMAAIEGRPRPEPEDPVEYTLCPNTLSGEHEWRNDVGKNAELNKKHGRACVHCSTLETDALV